jgi:uncharacterized Zn finger protein
MAARPAHRLELLNTLAMNALPILDEADIREWVGGQSFQRGLAYAGEARIFDTRQQGSTLKARCAGSQAEAYRVEVTLAADGILSADCSCPVGSSGCCKHVAALLLVHRDDPDAFVEVEELDAALARRSKEELIALVKQMLRQAPDLETLLEMRLPVVGTGDVPTEPAPYRRQAAAFFDRTGHDWGAWLRLAGDLANLRQIGDAFLQQGHAAAAAAVYIALAETIIERYDTQLDEDGDVAALVSDCVVALGQCLAELPEGSDARPAILSTLFAVYLADVAVGEIGLGDEAPELLVKHVTPDERETVAGWVREELEAAEDEWNQEALGGMLLDLQAECLDDEAFLQFCREAGRTGDAVERLLKLGRAEEAVAEAAQASDYDLISIAERLIQHGVEDRAEALVEQRAGGAQNRQLLEWLKQRRLEHQDHEAALALAERLFLPWPHLDLYREIRDLARRLHGWEEVRPKLLAELKAARFTQLRVDIHLDEGELDDALSLVHPERQPSGGHVDRHTRLKVALAAEAARPRAALAIYTEVVERLIGNRGRGNYQEAAQLLRRVRALHERLGEEPDWHRYLDGLRQHHPRLPALREELQLAGLL